MSSGLNNIELGLRLRYELDRQVAPNVDISWMHKFGETANFAQQAEENIDNFSILGGLANVLNNTCSRSRTQS